MTLHSNRAGRNFGVAAITAALTRLMTLLSIAYLVAAAGTVVASETTVSTSDCVSAFHTVISSPNDGSSVFLCEYKLSSDATLTISVTSGRYERNDLERSDISNFMAIFDHSSSYILTKTNLDGLYKVGFLKGTSWIYDPLRLDSYAATYNGNLYWIRCNTVNNSCITYWNIGDTTPPAPACEIYTFNQFDYARDKLSNIQAALEISAKVASALVEQNTLGQWCK